MPGDEHYAVSTLCWTSDLVADAEGHPQMMCETGQRQLTQNCPYTQTRQGSGIPSQQDHLTISGERDGRHTMEFPDNVTEP